MRRAAAGKQAVHRASAWLGPGAPCRWPSASSRVYGSLPWSSWVTAWPTSDEAYPGKFREGLPYLWLVLISWQPCLSELPHRCARYPNRLPILSASRTSMSADGTDSAAPSTSIGMLPDQHG